MDANNWLLAQFSVDVTPFLSKDISFIETENKKLVCGLGGVDFVSFDKEGASDHERFHLLVRKNGTIRFREVTPTLFRPRVIDPGPVKSLEDDAAVTAGMSEKDAAFAKRAAKRAANRDKLTEAFGSAKNMRKLSDSRQLNLSAGSREFMKAAEEAERVRQAASTRSEDTIRDLLPPYDLAATSPSMAYDMSEVVAPRLLALLSEQTRALIEASAGVAEGYPRCVERRLAALPVDPERRQAMAARLALLAVLVRVHRLSFRDLSRRVPLPELAPPAAYLLLERYTELTAASSSSSSQSRCMPARLKDKVVYHSLLLCLSLDNWSCDIADLLIDFKMPAIRMTKYFLALGCTIKKATIRSEATQIATLTVPLTFPKITFAARKKKN